MSLDKITTTFESCKVTPDDVIEGGTIVYEPARTRTWLEEQLRKREAELRLKDDELASAEAVIKELNANLGDAIRKIQYAHEERESDSDIIALKNRHKEELRRLEKTTVALRRQISDLKGKFVLVIVLILTMGFCIIVVNYN